MSKSKTSLGPCIAIIKITTEKKYHFSLCLEKIKPNKDTKTTEIPINAGAPYQMLSLKCQK